MSRKWKFLGLLAVMVLGVGGVAKGGDLIGGIAPGVEAREGRFVEVIGKRQSEVKGAYERVRRGPRGPRGLRGPRGAQGPQGTFGSVAAVSSPPQSACGYFGGGCAVQSTQVACPPGTILTGGGYAGAGIRAFISAPAGNGWFVGATNESEFSTTFEAYALCASA